jgi:hypothetical protein
MPPRAAGTIVTSMRNLTGLRQRRCPCMIWPLSAAYLRLADGKIRRPEAAPRACQSTRNCFPYRGRAPSVPSS